jgi:hypothetical protein
VRQRRKIVLLGVGTPTLTSYMCPFKIWYPDTGISAIFGVTLLSSVHPLLSVTKLH